jgi:hypothetical protein
MPRLRRQVGWTVLCPPNGAHRVTRPTKIPARHTDAGDGTRVIKDTTQAELPPGCEVTYELEAIEILKKLIRLTSGEHAIVQYYQEFRDLHETRPMVAEAYHDGYNPRILRRSYTLVSRCSES